MWMGGDAKESYRDLVNCDSQIPPKRQEFEQQVNKLYPQKPGSSKNNLFLPTTTVKTVPIYTTHTPCLDDPGSLDH